MRKPERKPLEAVHSSKHVRYLQYLPSPHPRRHSSRGCLEFCSGVLCGISKLGIMRVNEKVHAPSNSALLCETRWDETALIHKSRTSCFTVLANCSHIGPFSLIEPSLTTSMSELSNARPSGSTHGRRRVASGPSRWYGKSLLGLALAL